MIIDQNIETISALVMPQLVIDENVMCFASQETVLAARKHVSATIRRDEPDGKIMICALKPDENGRGYTFSDITRFAEKLCCLNRRWMRRALDCMVVLEIDLTALLELNSQPCSSSTLLGNRNEHRTTEAGAFNRAIMSTRNLFCEITRMGLAVGISLQDPLLPQYFGDQVCWVSIKEANIESQLHRQLASTMSMPVAFIPDSLAKGPGKCLDACLSAKGAHTFFSMTKEGTAALVEGTGNDLCHITIPCGDYTRIESIRESLLVKNVGTRLLLQTPSNIHDNDFQTALKHECVAGIRMTIANTLDVDPSEVIDELGAIMNSSQQASPIQPPKRARNAL